MAPEAGTPRRRAGDPPPRPEPAAAPRPAASVLAGRLAAALMHHEPGWRLPRQSVLIRRYGVSAAEMNAAVDELIGRHLIRRLADGQLYKASPAEYLIGLEGIPGLVSYVDAMGRDVSCRSSQLSWRQPPQGISQALRVPASQQVCVLRLGWASGGEPAAVCTTYVPADLAGQPGGAAGPQPDRDGVAELAQIPSGLLACQDGGPVTGVPGALHVELQAPSPAVARSLRLAAGQPAIMIMIRFDDPGLGRPVALTTAALRADMFRLVVQSPEGGMPEDSAPGPWPAAPGGMSAEDLSADGMGSAVQPAPAAR